MSELNKMIFDSRFAHKEIKPNFSDSAEWRWEQKEIIASVVVHDCNSLNNVSLHGSGTLTLSNERYMEGNSSLLLTTSTDIEDIRPRPSSSVHFSLGEQDYSQYNRLSLWVYPEATGFQNFYFHISLFGKDEKPIAHAPSLKPNEWNHVLFEIDNFPLHALTKITVGPLLLGCPPEAEPTLKIFIDKLEMQKVECDYPEGWDLDSRIAYCHSGYLPFAKKIALTQKAEENKFYLFDEHHHLAFEKMVKPVTSDLGSFFEMDFSEFTKPGIYYLQIDNRKTNLFDISERAYHASIWKSLNFLRMLRCGEDVPEVHSPCHLNHYSIHPDGRMVPDFGGWHDAGDVSQFEICTAEIAQSLLEMALSFKERDSCLYERLLEEAKVGVNWLLRTRFNDGYRALAVHYSIWRKNIVKGSEAFASENPIYSNNIAENGPFENFLASSCEALGYKLFKEENQVFADWCLRSAIEDFWFAVTGYQEGIYTKRWGPGPDAQVCGAAISAAIELFKITKEEKYLTHADQFASIVVSCQQQEYLDWELPLRGFFYEDVNHSKLLIYEHRGHEQTPIQGLVSFCEAAPDHPNFQKYHQAIMLYAEYIEKTSSMISPYKLLPAHVYEEEKVNLTRITVPPKYATFDEVKASLKKQIESGIKLAENVYLRRFPIAIQRRGYHATLLSKTRAVSLIAKYLNNQNLKQIALDQLEWILGKNPFSSSTMYGEGSNYHPLYVAFSRQIVGSLPVGIKTRDHFDAPYWPVINNSVFKEIWGHTTGKYLWILADLL